MPKADLQFCPVSSTGQVTIPKPLRKALHLRPGKDGVGFRVSSGRVEVVPVRLSERPLRFSRKELARLTRLRRKPGRIFRSVREFREYLAGL